MIVKVSLTVAILVAWFVLCGYVSAGYGSALAGLEEDEHKKEFRWWSLKGSLWSLLITGVAAFGIALAR